MDIDQCTMRWVENGKKVNKSTAKEGGIIHLHSVWWKELAQHEIVASLCKALKIELQVLKLNHIYNE